jgi:hypothetical protein
MKKIIVSLTAFFLLLPANASASIISNMQSIIDQQIQTNNKGESYFPDVALTHKNFYAITFFFINKIIQGYPDGTYKPNNPINRAELMKLVVSTNNSNEIDAVKYSNCFPDVKDEWFAKYVCYAKEQGWISGYPDKTFKPENYVNRAEAIKIGINSSLEKAQIPDLTTAQMALQMPSDMDKSAWYANYLRFAIIYELLDGQHVTKPEDGSYQYYPGDSMMRKEVAEMLFRISAYIVERDQYALVMAKATCYYIINQNDSTTQELNKEMIRLAAEGGFTSDEMDVLSAKYKNDIAVQSDITNQAMSACGTEAAAYYTQQTTQQSTQQAALQ